MNKKLTYEELTNKVQKLENSLLECERVEVEIKNIFELSLDMIGSGNLEGYFTKINSSFESILGYPQEEILKKPFLSFVHDDDIKETSNALKSAAQGRKQIHITNRYRCKNGTYKYIEWKVRVVAQKNQFIAVGRDITDRKTAEQALIASEIKYRTLFESNAFISYITDIKGNILLANKNAAEFFNESRETIIGKSFFELRPDRKEHYQNIIDTILGSGKTIQFETSFPHPSGEKWLNVTVSPLKIHNNLQLQIITQDMTQRKKAEQEKYLLQERLNRSKKMEAIGLLAGGVAHDLNNVLSVIVSYPEIILMSLPENSEFKKQIEAILEAGHDASAIVQDLLTVASGVATIKEPLNLNNVINDFLNSPDFITLQQIHSKVIVNTILDRNLLNLTGSQVHIRKIVMNLVANAFEAIRGYGRITISTQNTYVEKPIRGYDDVKIGEYVVLSVSDNGSGISSDDIERIFEPFFTKKILGRRGTGLGLAIVWNAVQDHKGYINVSNDENGTIFQLFFPITRDEIANKKTSIPIQDYRGNGETILVVDDLENQREIACKILGILGYKAIAVSSGEAAIEYLKNHSVDLLLLDMIMDPGINGCETYERALALNPRQKAIITSGFSETEAILETQRLGAGKFLKKPFTVETIGLAIMEELNAI